MRVPSHQVAARQVAAHQVAALIAGLAGLSAACAGPRLRVACDGACYLDGRRVHQPVQEFRYYGTTVIDAVPDRRDGAGNLDEFSRTATRTLVQVPAPVSPWLFPLDFLGELVLAVGGDRDLEVTANTAPAAEAVVLGFPPGGLEDLRSRAVAARVAR